MFFLASCRHDEFAQDLLGSHDTTASLAPWPQSSVHCQSGCFRCGNRGCQNSLLWCWRSGDRPQHVNSRQTSWALFFTRLNFTPSYHHWSHNMKQVSCSWLEAGDCSQDSSTILPPGCLVNMVTWDVVNKVQCMHPNKHFPNEFPYGWLFFPGPLCSWVLHWGSHPCWAVIQGWVRLLVPFSNVSRGPPFETMLINWSLPVLFVLAARSPVVHWLVFMRPLPVLHPSWFNIFLDFVSGFLS